MAKLRSVLLPIIGLVFCVIIFFHQAVIGNKIIVLGDFSGSDLLEMQLPHKYILRESVLKGEFPLWSVYNGTGFPVHAEGQGGYFYPINLFLVWLEPYQALNFSILLAVLIAGIGVFLFARTLPHISNRGALIAAIVFMFSSFFIARMKHLNMIAVACWLPMSLLCIRMLCIRSKYVYSLSLGLVWGMMFLAGHPQMAYYNVIIGLWWGLGEVFYRAVVMKDAPLDLKRLIRYGISAMIVGVGIAAVQIMPSLELIQYSYRAEQSSFFAATAFPFNPAFLFSLFNPYLLGNPADATYPKDISFWGVWWENVWYVGLIPILSLFYLIYIVMRKWRVQVLTQNFLTTYFYPIFVCVGLVVFAFISLGRSSVLYLLLYYIAPGMQMFRFPQRFGIFVLLAISLLFGWLVSYLLMRIKDRMKRHFLWNAAVLVCLLDLYMFAHKYIVFENVRDYFQTPIEALITTKESIPSTRIYPTFAYVQNPYLFLGWRNNDKETIKVMNSMVPGNMAAMYGLHSFSDRDWFEGGLDISDLSSVEWKLLNESLDIQGLDTKRAARLLGLWNVEYVQTVVPFENPAYQLVHSENTSSEFYPQYFVYKNEYVMPRGFVVSSVKNFDSKDGLRDYMFSDDFRLQEAGLVLNRAGLVFESDDVDSEVSIVKYSAQAISAEVSLDKHGLFVISDLLYPGWNVLVDGVQVEPVSVNLVQRGVILEEGTHIVEWKFKPHSFYAGLVVSVLAGVTVLGLFIFTFWKRYT